MSNVLKNCKSRTLKLIYDTDEWGVKFLIENKPTYFKIKSNGKDGVSGGMDDISLIVHKEKWTLAIWENGKKIDSMMFLPFFKNKDELLK